MEKNKQVNFSNENNKNHAQDFTFFTAKQKKLPSSSKLRRTWIELCLAKQYDILKQILTSASNQGLAMKDFFSQEGRILLEWAIVLRSESELFQFLCENVPASSILAVIKQDNFDILKTFLLVQSRLDEHRKTNLQTIESRIEKLRLLLTINTKAAERLQTNLENIISEQPISEEVKASYKEALLRYKNQSNLLSLT